MFDWFFIMLHLIEFLLQLRNPLFVLDFLHVFLQMAIIKPVNANNIVAHVLDAIKVILISRIRILVVDWEFPLLTT